VETLKPFVCEQIHPLVDRCAIPLKRNLLHAAEIIATVRIAGLDQALVMRDHPANVAAGRGHLMTNAALVAERTRLHRCGASVG